jgi:NAD(P)-dependent dehydrogenase (short-subunit alcohol dehydrogenase family)
MEEQRDMSPRTRFEDQVVVITGSARGIGLATAELAAGEGARVVICDLNRQAVDAAVDAIAARGGRAMGVVGDVSNASQVRANVEEIMAEHGRIDALVNNAAINTYHPTATMPEEMWSRELAICLTGTFLWSQAVGNAAMIPSRRGSIVNLGSGAALAGLPNCAAYIAAKHGIVGLTKSLAVDWGQYNIRVNCVCPGLTFTELSKAVAEKNPEMMRQREQRIPLQRGAQPIDIARTILFLASCEADAISGISVAVDGGTMALSSGFSAPRDG